MVFLLTGTVCSQTHSLRKNLNQIIQPVQGKIGVAIQDLETGDTLTIHGHEHYPLQSVFKFHLALAILHQMDQGNLMLDQKIFINKSDLIPGTYSPMADKYPGGNVELPLREILNYTVSQSDNNGCDILFGLLGGPQQVDDYIHSLGISGVSIQATEAEMAKHWNVQYTNWTTPFAAVQLLEKFYHRKILSRTGHDFLWDVMSGPTTGGSRIPVQLPEGTPVAHKTGTSGTKDGIRGAANDIGIVTLPNGGHFAIAIFVSDSPEPSQTIDKTIASIAKITWDEFVR